MGKTTEWTIRPGKSAGVSVGVSATANEYFVEKHNKSFKLYFVGVGGGISIGVKAIQDKMKGRTAAGSLESLPSGGSPLYESTTSVVGLPYGNKEGKWWLSGPGLVLEGGGMAGIGASVQVLFFNWSGTFTDVPGVILEALMATNTSMEFGNAKCSHFGSVAGVGAGLGAELGFTIYPGMFV